MSRRILDARFAARVGHTPHEEIARHRFRRVEQLLAETDLPLAGLAQAVTRPGKLGKAASRLGPDSRLVRPTAWQYGFTPSGERS